MRGVATLLRFYLRRDRLMIPLWIGGIFLIYYAQAVSIDGLYPTQAELDLAAATMGDNAAFIAMAGPARALNTIGGQVAWQSAAFGAVTAGLMSMFLMGRHTRADEESGRDELLRASAIGRRAPIIAASILVGLANVALGVAVTLGLVSYGLAWAGSVSLGVSLGLAGMVFGAVALIAMQLTDGTRSAYGITGAVIALAFALRAIGDVGDQALSWLSPIGWGQAMRAYADEIWWPALLSVVAIAAMIAVALGLFERRDAGSGLWASRPGPARATTGLQSAWGLAWRLQRGSVKGWSLGAFAMGIAYGSIGDEVGDLLGDSEFSRDMFSQGGGTLIDSFYATAAAMLALLAGGFVVSSVLRMRGEESAGHAETLLATALPRRRWALANLQVSLLGLLACLVLGGAGLALGFAGVTGDWSHIGPFVGAALQYASPLALLLGLTWFAYAARSSWGALGWAELALCVVVLMFAEVLSLPGWVRALSPFEHVSLVPAESFALVPWLAMAALAGLLVAAGLMLFSARDIDNR